MRPSQSREDNHVDTSLPFLLTRSGRWKGACGKVLVVRTFVLLKSLKLRSLNHSLVCQTSSWYRLSTVKCRRYSHSLLTWLWLSHLKTGDIPDWPDLVTYTNLRSSLNQFLLLSSHWVLYLYIIHTHVPWSGRKFHYTIFNSWFQEPGIYLVPGINW